MKSPRDLLQAALDVGPLRTAYRVAWEVDRRSGFKRLRQPVGSVPMPSDVPDWGEWWVSVPAESWLRELPVVEPASDVSMRRAERAVDGEIQLFGAWEVEVGSPPNWHLEPHSGRTWPRRAHWTDALDAGSGDPRITWELNRFLHVWDWIRAWRRDHDPRWVVAFEGHMESWAHENPFRAGINWASGQELAVRVVSWLAAVCTFGEHLDPASFRTFVELAYWHGVQIETELDFARRAVPNNHLIAEAAALATLGALFSWRESSRWRARGLELLREAVKAQFRDDGGYCQSSHTYHRFALEWLLFAEGMFPEFHAALSGVFERSATYFETLMGADGRVANFGPNDGARLWRASDADDRDFRPLVAALRDRVGGIPASPASRRFVASGIHQLRVGTTRVQLRAGAPPRRGGHADQLHLDLWHNGAPVAIDAGSYSYASQDHPWFSGSASHNGVLVDGAGQMELATPFTWIGESPAVLREWCPNRGRMVAECEAYADRQIRWDREVRLDGQTVVVVDRLSPTGRGLHDHEFRLHWLLDTPIAVERATDDGWVLAGDRQHMRIRVRAVVGRLRSRQLQVVESRQSCYYGALQPATGVRCDARARGLEFETRFDLR